MRITSDKKFLGEIQCRAGQNLDMFTCTSAAVAHVYYAHMMACTHADMDMPGYLHTYIHTYIHASILA